MKAWMGFISPRTDNTLQWKFEVLPFAKGGEFTE